MSKVMDDDIDEKSLRERMDKAEKERIKRQEERQRRKKDRRNRVEKMVYQERPVPMTEKEKFDMYAKEIFQQLEHKERMLEKKMKQMEEKFSTTNTQSTKKIETKLLNLEDKLVNDFIKKITIENYNKLDEKLKNLTTNFSEQLEKISIEHKNNDSQESQQIKSMLLTMQNKLKNMEGNMNKKKDVTDEDEIQYEQLQKQINDITLLLAQRDQNRNNINVSDLEKRMKNIVNQNVDEIYSKLDKKIDLKLHQENRINDILKRVAKVENISEQILSKPETNVDQLMDNVIEQLQHNNDKRMEKMYTELRKRIHNIENLDDGNVKMKEHLIKDMERRIYEIEVYKKKLDRDEERKQKRKEKMIRKDEKRNFTKKKNRILRKHNLDIDNDISDEEKEEKINDIKTSPFTLLTAIVDEEKKNPYMELYKKVRTMVPRRTLSPYDQKNIDNLFRDLRNKNERYRSKAVKVMMLKKNLLENKYSAKKAYGVSRGIIILDEKENERVKIYKKFNSAVKERFVKKCEIFLKYMHNFSFSFTNALTKEVLTIYYNDVKPYLIYIEHKYKGGRELEKRRRKFNIGEELTILIESFEDQEGEHLNIYLDRYEIKFSKMLRIMDIQSNCFYEIEIQEFDDEELFDV